MRLNECKQKKPLLNLALRVQLNEYLVERYGRVHKTVARQRHWLKGNTHCRNQTVLAVRGSPKLHYTVYSK